LFFFSDKPTNIHSDYREEERLSCVLVLDSFNIYINEIAAHTTLPLCLWPVDGQPLLDYTIHTLIRSGIQEIILLATSNSYEIRSYLMNSHWLRTYPKLIRLIPCKEARSLGDCLKDLEQENIINNHFLLLYGNGTLLTNEKLNNLFYIHKENIKKDKNCVMTLVYRQLDSNHLEHPSFTDDQHLYIVRDANTHRLYDYSNEYLDTYEIPLDLLEKPNVTIETLYCPLDCHLAVCSPDVIHLFKDNFDFLTINEFVKGKYNVEKNNRK
jgi:translation initiation factor eIF-2B subunit epsilon